MPESLIVLFERKLKVYEDALSKDINSTFYQGIVKNTNEFLYKLYMQHRTTNDVITKLNENQIFVFGSNLSGKHGKGAAKTAMGWGAIYGQGAGLQGKTYGIPTKAQSVYKTLTITQIKPYVDSFIEFAKSNPDKTFLVTAIGTGLAGYKAKDIAPLFKDAISINNIHLPSKFWHKLQL